jgi:tetratricopeptide (TPR) repeat protein
LWELTQSWIKVNFSGVVALQICSVSTAVDCAGAQFAGFLVSINGKTFPGHKIRANKFENNMSASLVTLHDRVEVREAVRLSAIEDPEDDPFKSKYEAREMLQRVQADYVAQLIPFVCAVGECAADPQKAEIAACLGAVEVMLGNNHIHCEELSAGEKLLQEAIDHLKIAAVPLVCCELIDAYNSLGILWSHRNEHQKSKHWIQLAVDVYNQLQDGELSETRRSKVESLYTHTLFYMAQACQHTGEVERAVDLCQQTIDRQLNETQPDLSECAKNCMFLATYYLTRRHFRQVQYFLSAADQLFSQVPAPTGGSTEAHDTMKATLARARADFSLQWLKISAEQLIRQQKSSEFEIVNDIIFTFSKLEVPEPPPYQLATNFDEARPIFMQAQTHFNRALEHYVLSLRVCVLLIFMNQCFNFCLCTGTGRIRHRSYCTAAGAERCVQNPDCI